MAGHTEAGGREMRALLLWLVLCAASGQAARLLAVLPTNTRSHYAMYGRIIEALAGRDHHLTVITHFPMVSILVFCNQLAVGKLLNYIEQTNIQM